MSDNLARKQTGYAPASAQLPGVLQEIAEAAGLRAALRLAAIYGGQTVYIPGRIDEDHWLVHAVGFEAAEKICEAFRLRGSGSKLLIPMARRSLLNLALAKGCSIREAVAAFRVHERTVWRARRRMKERGEIAAQNPQIDFFESD